MKKVFSLLLVLSLAFGLTGCLTLNSDDHGVGKVIVSKDVNLMRPDDSGVMVPAKDPITVTINGEEKVLGEEFTLQDGTYEILFKSEGKYVIPAEENKVKVKAGENTVLNSLDENKMLLAQAEIKFSLDPANYDSISEVNTAYLAGAMNGWSDSAADYKFTDADGDGVYTVTATVVAGDAYKFVINGNWIVPADAEELKDDGQGGKNAVVTLEQVLAAQ